MRYSATNMNSVFVRASSILNFRGSPEGMFLMTAQAAAAAPVRLIPFWKNPFQQDKNARWSQMLFSANFKKVPLPRRDTGSNKIFSGSTKDTELVYLIQTAAQTERGGDAAGRLKWTGWAGGDEKGEMKETEGEEKLWCKKEKGAKKPGGGWAKQVFFLFSEIFLSWYICFSITVEAEVKVRLRTSAFHGAAITMF